MTASVMYLNISSWRVVGLVTRDVSSVSSVTLRSMPSGGREEKISDLGEERLPSDSESAISITDMGDLRRRGVVAVVVWVGDFERAPDDVVLVLVVSAAVAVAVLVGDFLRSSDVVDFAIDFVVVVLLLLDVVAAAVGTAVIDAAVPVRSGQSFDETVAERTGGSKSSGATNFSASLLTAGL